MTKDDFFELIQEHKDYGGYVHQDTLAERLAELFAAGASEGQAEPVAWITEAKYPAPRFVFGSVDPSEVWKQPYTPLYDHRPFIDEFCKAYAEEWQDTLKEQSDCIKARDAEIAALRERIAGMEKAQAFAGIVLGTYRAELGDLDGFWLQEQAAAHGLTEERTATARCGEDCTCAEVTTFPTSCFFITEAGQAAIDASSVASKED